MIYKGVKEQGFFTPDQLGGFELKINHENKNKFEGTGIPTGNETHAGGQSDPGG